MKSLLLSIVLVTGFCTMATANDGFVCRDGICLRLPVTVEKSFTKVVKVADVEVKKIEYSTHRHRFRLLPRNR